MQARSKRIRTSAVKLCSPASNSNIYLSDQRSLVASERASAARFARPAHRKAKRAGSRKDSAPVCGSYRPPKLQSRHSQFLVRPLLAEIFSPHSKCESLIGGAWIPEGTHDVPDRSYPRLETDSPPQRPGPPKNPWY